METSLEINVFNISELEKVRIEREKTLSDYRAKEKEEQELLSLLNELRTQKDEVRRKGYLLRAKIDELEREETLRIQQEQELAALKLEAQSLQAYENKLEELCVDFPAWQRARPYQKEDLVFSLKCFLEGKSGLMNANDMSMGKTMEAVILLYVIKKLHPDWKILWLTKKTLTISSPKEIKRWWPEAYLVTSAAVNDVKGRNFVLEMVKLGADILVANYEFVRSTPKVKDVNWNVIVVDEAHKLKGGANPGGPTDIWVKVKELCLTSNFNIFLTGTPMVNAPEEMWSYLHIFDPVKFPKLRDFQNAFMEYRSFSRNFTMETKATKLLQNVLKGQMFRRSRFEVNLQLPPITEEVIELEMTPKQREIYDQMRLSFFVWLDENQDTALTATAILAQLTRLRQISVWPSNIRFKTVQGERVLNVEESAKIDEAEEIIQRVNEQIVVFGTFNEPLFEIQRRCQKMGISCQVLWGDNSHLVGQFESQFQNGKIQVLCMNSAVGEGLNLNKNPLQWEGGASYGIMLDKWWSPARNEQCLSRIVRPGSTDTGVFYYLENIRSVDAFINELLIEKKDSFESITESAAIRPNWREYLENLI